jgi:hypothetical protein
VGFCFILPLLPQKLNLKFNILDKSAFPKMDFLHLDDLEYYALRGGSFLRYFTILQDLVI